MQEKPRAPYRNGKGFGWWKDQFGHYINWLFLFSLNFPLFGFDVI